MYFIIVPQPVSSIMATVTNTTDIGVYNIVVEWEVSDRYVVTKTTCGFKQTATN